MRNRKRMDVVKRIVKWIKTATSVIWLVAWGIVGLKLIEHNYDYMAEIYIAIVCGVILLACVVYKLFSNRCPYCGRPKESNGLYCPYCGKKAENDTYLH